MNRLIDSRLPRPPIIIGGCGRSGTTLLLAVLSAQTAIHAVPFESEVFCPTAWSGHLDLNAPFEIDRLTDYLAQADIRPGQTRWCEKSPKNILFFGRILDYFDSEVRLINIVRDGRDVVTSYHPTRRREKPWVSPQRWLDDVSVGAEFDDHPQAYVIRYEDLVARFEATMTDLLNFLGEPVPSDLTDWPQRATVRRHVAWADGVKPIHADSLQRWKKPEFKPYVDELLADPRAEALLRRYGYLAS